MSGSVDRSWRRAVAVGGLSVVTAALLAAPAQAAPGVGGNSPAPVQDFLADQLEGLAGAARTTVLVHGTDIDAARASADPSTWPDLSAPGENITSSCRLYLPICAAGLDPRNGPGLLDVGTFNTTSGTSMAGPHVADIVAQLFQADPTATPADIEAALKGTTHRFTDGAAYTSTGGYSTSYDKGTGLVDVVAAVARLTD